MRRLPCFHSLSSYLNTEETTSKQAARSGEVEEELGVSQNFRSIISLVTCLQRHRIIDYKLDNQRPKTDYLELGCVPDPIVVWDPL